MSTVYVGNLDPNASSKFSEILWDTSSFSLLLIIVLHVSCHHHCNKPAHDLRRAFDRYGKIIDIWVAQKPPGFAFVDFDKDKDAKGNEDHNSGMTNSMTG